MSAEELGELLEIRAGLFEIVIRKLAEQQRPEVLSMFKAGLVRLEALSKLPDAGDEYAETTYRIVILCARYCGNHRLQKLLTALSLQTLRYSKLGLATVARRRKSVALWRKAAVAYTQGDTELLVKLTRQRIDESADEAIRILKLQQSDEKKI